MANPASAASAIVAAGRAALIVLDKSTVEGNLDRIESNLEFLGNTAGGSVSKTGLLGKTLGMLQANDLPTVKRYREVSNRLDNLMVQFRQVAEKDIKAVRKVTEKLEEADHT